MEMPHDDSARQAIRDDALLRPAAAPTRSDLSNVLSRLPTKAELSRVLRQLDIETLQATVQSMENHLGVSLDPPGGPFRNGGAAVALAHALCSFHTMPVRLAVKTCKHWEHLDPQVHTDVLKVLLAYETALKRLTDAFDGLGRA